MNSKFQYCLELPDTIAKPRPIPPPKPAKKQHSIVVVAADNNDSEINLDEATTITTTKNNNSKPTAKSNFNTIKRKGKSFSHKVANLFHADQASSITASLLTNNNEIVSSDQLTVRLTNNNNNGNTNSEIVADHHSEEQPVIEIATTNRTKSLDDLLIKKEQPSPPSLLLQKKKSIESILTLTNNSSNKPTNDDASLEPVNNTTTSSIDPIGNKKPIQIVESTQTLNERLEKIYGSDWVPSLVCDYTKTIAINNSNRCASSSSSQITQEINSTESANMNSITTEQTQTSALTTVEAKKRSPEEIDLQKRQKVDEYYHIEEKQARLCKSLKENVYQRFEEENARQHYCDLDELNKIFYVVIELEKVALLVHEQIANEIKARLDTCWSEKPYFGDILVKYYHFYKTYTPILSRYPTCQLTLSSCLKRKSFATNLQRILV